MADPSTRNLALVKQLVQADENNYLAVKLCEKVGDYFTLKMGRVH
jgi:hypothetical protein